MGLAVPALTGCGDDTMGKPVDARPIDAKVVDAPPGPPDAPDAPPAPVFKGFFADEGGEVRAEYVRTAAGNAGTRVTAFLFKDSGTTKFFDYLNLNGCTDMTGKTKWPMATNPIAERVYANPGRVIITGGPSILEVPRRAVMGNDPFARTHPADQWFFDPFVGATDMDGGTYFTEKTSLDVTFTGSADMPGQIFDNVLFMPADFGLTTPDSAPVPIAAATDQTFTWETPPSNPPAGYEVMSLVAFTGGVGPAVVCIEPDDGSMTVPAAMIDVARATYPAGGTLARQKLTHVVRELVDNDGPTGKRIDFISVWCYATSFRVP